VCFVFPINIIIFSIQAFFLIKILFKKGVRLIKSMEMFNNYKLTNKQMEKDPSLFLQFSKNDQINIKNLSFLRQSTNSMESFLVHPSKDFNPFIFDKTNSIPELKDLNLERTLSRLKSRGSSNSKSPKNNLNFNGNNINNNNPQTNFLKDLETQWKNMKEDHQNFPSKNSKKSSFILNNNERDEFLSQNRKDQSISPSKLEKKFNQT